MVFGLITAALCAEHSREVIKARFIIDAFARVRTANMMSNPQTRPCV